MLHNPYKIVEMFEEEVAHYTGAPYAVAVDSCTNAIFLCLKYHKAITVQLPKHTYLSVALSVINAGAKIQFTDKTWKGIYRLDPYPIYDSAKRFTSGMYQEGHMMCLSFHAKKYVNIGKGGMILSDNKQAVEWLKRARYEGRLPVPYEQYRADMEGYNMYMTPMDAARGLLLMQNMDAHNPDLEEEYSDLSVQPLFSNGQYIDP